MTALISFVVLMILLCGTASVLWGAHVNRLPLSKASGLSIQAESGPLVPLDRTVTIGTAPSSSISVVAASRLSATVSVTPTGPVLIPGQGRLLLDGDIVDGPRSLHAGVTFSLEGNSYQVIDTKRAVKTDG